MCVGFDNAAAMAQAVRYLLDLGHRDIAMLAGQTRDNDRARARVQGVRQGLERARLTLPPSRLIERAYTLDAARDGLRVLLDARPTSEWLNSHIPGALPVPYYDSNRMTAKLPRDGTWILTYCGCPHAASGSVMDTLRREGFPRTAVIDEGIFEWIRRGYPITYGRSAAVGAPP